MELALHRRCMRHATSVNVVGAEWICTAVTERWCVPCRHQRRRVFTAVSQHPDTPDVKQICSKRSFDGQVKKWRRQLHFWDPVDEDSVEPVLVSRSSTCLQTE